MEKDEWFAKVKWCEDDLKSALEDRGFPATENNIAKLRNLCDNHWFTDHMIQAGWEYIYNHIVARDDWGEDEQLN